MISIVEPRLDQELSGRSVYNREIAAASGGEIIRVLADRGDLDGVRPGLTLYDSAWLASAESRQWFQTRASIDGILVHELPRDLETWREVLRKAKVIACKSPELAKAIEALNLGIAVQTVEPGRDLRLRMMQSQPREYDVLRIITIAHIMPRKGLIEAMRCLQALEQRGLEFHWYIFGEPTVDPEYEGSFDADEDYAERFVGMLEAFGWEDTVTCLGAQNLPAQLKVYVDMDLALFPSLAEGYGLALAEAAALGLPILATDTGAFKRLLKDDPEACLVPDLEPGRWDRIEAFLRRYVGCERNVRVNRRGHPLLERSWATAARELSAGIL